MKALAVQVLVDFNFRNVLRQISIDAVNSTVTRLAFGNESRVVHTDTDYVLTLGIDLITCIQ